MCEFDSHPRHNNNYYSQQNSTEAGTRIDMFDSIITIGSFQLRTLSVFQVIAFLSCAFIVWYRAREENYSEAKVFDGFLLSFLVGWLMGRLGHIFLAWDKFGWEILKWLNVVQYPGTQLLIGLVGATLYFFFYSKKQKWDAFEVLDWWAQALTMGLVFTNIGYFFAGTRFGSVTTLPWGVIFPGVFEKRHPIQLYYLLFHVLMYKLLNWLEYHYRTFEWYRSGKKTAQTGFVFASFVISYALFSFLNSFLQDSVFLIGETSLDGLIHISLLSLGLFILIYRSNRVLFSFKEMKFFVIKK